MAKVAFIGLGVMGFPMAGHLAAGGHDVTVYNRNPARAAAWLAQHKGSSAATAAEAVRDAQFVFVCIGNDNDLYQVILEEGGVLAAMAPGSILIDHTTASAEAARTIFAAAQARSVAFLDAPVSGGQAGAENGKLTVMVGGKADAYAAAEPLMALFARAVTHMGASGAGQLTKMVNQICIAGLVQALSEGVAFAENAGLDASLVVDVISKGAAQSWQMENRGKTMIERKFDFGFAVDLMRKDLGICLAEARRNGSDLPVTELTDRFYAEVQQAGGNRFDTSSLITRLNRK